MSKLIYGLILLGITVEDFLILTRMIVTGGIDVRTAGGAIAHLLMLHLFWRFHISFDLRNISIVGKFTA